MQEWFAKDKARKLNANLIMQNYVNKGPSVGSVLCNISSSVYVK